MSLPSLESDLANLEKKSDLTPAGSPAPFPRLQWLLLLARLPCASPFLLRKPLLRRRDAMEARSSRSQKESPQEEGEQLGGPTAEGAEGKL